MATAALVNKNKSYIFFKKLKKKMGRCDAKFGNTCKEKEEVKK